MRPWRANKILGIAIGEQAILVAEVVRAGPRRELRRCAEFRYPEGVSSASLESLGRPLRQFLRQQGFSARHAVVGLPASWVMVKTKELPPADPAAAAEILRLQSESDFSTEFKGLVYDYAGESDRNQPAPVLLMAVPSERLTQIEGMIHGADLVVTSVTPSVAALASASRARSAPGGLVIYLAPGSAELAIHNGHGLNQLRHVAGSAGETTHHGAVAPELLAGLRRSLAGLASGSSTPATEDARRLVLWDGSGLDEAGRTFVGHRLGMTVEPQSLSALGVTTALKEQDFSRYAPAVALAVSGLADEALSIDFAHPRLAPPRARTKRRTIAWAVAIGAAVLLAAGVSLNDTRRQQVEVQNLQNQLAAMGPDILAAKAAAERVAYVRNWHDASPRFLNCVRALTLAFPEDGSAWAVNIDIQADLKGHLAGKATSEKTALAIMDRLKAGGKFKDVKLLDLRNEGRGAGEVAFSLGFIFVGTE